MTDFGLPVTARTASKPNLGICPSRQKAFNVKSGCSCIRALFLRGIFV